MITRAGNYFMKQRALPYDTYFIIYYTDIKTNINNMYLYYVKNTHYKI